MPYVLRSLALSRTHDVLGHHRGGPRDSAALRRAGDQRRPLLNRAIDAAAPTAVTLL